MLLLWYKVELTIPTESHVILTVLNCCCYLVALSVTTHNSHIQLKNKIVRLNLLCMWIRQAMYVKHNNVARSPSHCCSKNETIYYNIFCVFLALSRKWHDFLKKKNILNKRCIFIFSSNLCRRFFILRLFTEIMSQTYVCLYVK